MNTITDFDFNGHKALIRVDFNVPLDKETQAVTDDTRLRAALPTINKILGDGGSVILMSHLGRPKDGPEEKYSMKHVIGRLESLLGRPVLFATDCIGESAASAASKLQPGEVLLLENLRFHPEETKGDEDFAEQLSRLGDVYVNDAFGTAHRAHASTTIVAKFFDAGHRMAGLLLAAEVEAGTKVLRNAEKPFTAIIGGAKVSDKILILEKLLDLADNIIIGGGMAYTFYKAQGGHIGSSLCEEDRLDAALQLLEQASAKGVNVYLPEDSILADRFAADAATQVTASKEIPDGWMGLDIGPAALREFSYVIAQSKTILWNGPMGVFEMEAFQKGTAEVAQAIARASAQGAYSLVGGGDSVAAINTFHLSDKVSYVSTGGGAMLEFFEGKELPGVAALN
ncbi:MAG: phosphoglycerate kinase [Chitinophagales bacterium]|nr:phosphoglycerate kinase [Chitinophagales bacterium]MCB9020743.1 phosphoglycerate kinase [Chitinophagales bacterium]HQU38555.1 phosphoglycerate kinase [Chitinophagales bacterium]HQU75867.1 phosphoglycerate kinase [Chitinophagales bacterium]HRX22753.1 phosphoglycerate kinase [Chitinophagales bacterium]